MGWLTDWFWYKKVCEPVVESAIAVDLERLRKEARDHILYMLGAPVTKLELDDAQLEHAIDYTVELIDYAGFSDEMEYSVLIKEGSLSYAKYMLGRIRVLKFTAQPGSPDDGFTLVNEANRDIEAFRAMLEID